MPSPSSEATFTPPPTIILFSPDTHTPLLPSIVSLHSACITIDGTVATFLPPLSAEKMMTWWTERVEEVKKGIREIVICIEDKKVTRNPDADGASGEVIGVAMLHMSLAETGPWRAEVEKYFVSPACRRRGIGRAIMEKIEKVAKERGRLLLTPDTETGSPAESVYPRLVYKEVGKIPVYSISPIDRSLRTETFFCKDLRRP